MTRFYPPRRVAPARARSRTPLRAAVAVGLLAACAALGRAPIASAATVALEIDDGAGLADERALFVEARAALAGGDRERFRAAIPELEGYPLQRRLAFEDLEDRWRRTEPGRGALVALESFATDHDDATLSRRLARTLQTRLARTGQWPLYLELERSSLGVEMPCTTLRARAETEGLDGFDEAATALWIRPVRHPSVCRDALEALAEDHVPDIVAIWERIYAAIDANEPEIARETLRWLGTADRRAVEGWLDAIDDPGPYLRSDALAADEPLNRRAVADLVLRWSRQDTGAATDWWLDNQDRWTFFRDRWYDTFRELVLRSAWRRLPEAYDRLSALVPREDDLELMEWRVRAALLAGDWLEVMRSLYRLPTVEREEDHWAYWEARALETAGHGPEARAIYERLADLQSWHGFLAADRLGLDYSIVDEPIEADPTLVGELDSDPALVRAREYARVGLPAESRREWANALSDASAERLAAAAVLAAAWDMPDRAVLAAGQADARRALSYRFPVLYEDEVARAAAEHRVEPAWIYGVMRRESAFQPDVVSSAGAIGLMQMMPATALDVARRRGLDAGRIELTDGAFNIDFGTWYLGHVAERFDGHPALATASYNAGPTRVRSWLPEESDMEADRWIDTIPFSETRRYVRAVLAYAAIYEQRLTGRATRLSERLGPVRAERADSDRS